MNSKTIGMALGGVLIIIALILGGLQLFVYGETSMLGDRRLYAYGLFGVIGLIGLILLGWAYLKK